MEASTTTPHPGPPAADSAGLVTDAPEAYAVGDSVNGHTLTLTGWHPTAKITNAIDKAVRRSWWYLLLLPIPLIAVPLQSVNLFELRKARRDLGVPRSGPGNDSAPLVITVFLVVAVTVLAGLVASNRAAVSAEDTATQAQSQAAWDRTVYAMWEDAPDSTRAEFCSVWSSPSRGDLRAGLTPPQQEQKWLALSGLLDDKC